MVLTLKESIFVIEEFVDRKCNNDPDGDLYNKFYTKNVDYALHILLAVAKKITKGL